MLWAGLGLAAGLAVTAWLSPDRRPREPAAIPTDGAAGLDVVAPGPPVAPAVQGEDTAGARAGRASSATPGAASAPDDAAADDAAAADVASDVLDEELEPALEFDAPLETEPARTAPSVDALVAAGFEPERAAEIARRASALGPEAAAAELAASGTIRALGGGAARARGQALRAELGDADYERYLAASRQATRVVVATVTTDSPAQHAGIAPGDVIVAYAGQRVFNQRELNALSLAGTPGELVTATVLRDGQPLELYVARGPLGLTP